MIPRFGDSGYQKFRGNMFIALGLSAALPFVYLGFNTDYEYIMEESKVRPFLVGGAFYIFGAILYMYRLTERLWPKTFDIIGNSHSIFHICVVIGAYIHAC